MKVPMIHDSNGQPSLTATAFVVGFLLVSLKLLFSGVEFNGLKLSDFSGTDYAAAVGALGAVYTLRNKMPKPKEKEEETK